MHDPLPPINSDLSVYDTYLEERETAANQTRRLQGNPLYLLLESMIPGWTPEQAMQLDNENSVSRIVTLLRQNAANLFGNTADADDLAFEDDELWENPPDDDFHEQ
jgi:hypothetical protein